MNLPNKNTSFAVKTMDWTIVTCQRSDGSLLPSLISLRGPRLEIPDVDVLQLVRRDDDPVVEQNRSHVH